MPAPGPNAPRANGRRPLSTPRPLGGPTRSGGGCRPPGPRSRPHRAAPFRRGLPTAAGSPQRTGAARPFLPVPFSLAQPHLSRPRPSHGAAARPFVGRPPPRRRRAPESSALPHSATVVTHRSPPPLPPGRARPGRALNGAGRAPGAAPDRIRESLGLEKSCEIVWCNHHPTTDVTH